VLLPAVVSLTLFHSRCRPMYWRHYWEPVTLFTTALRAAAMGAHCARRVELPASRVLLRFRCPIRATAHFAAGWRRMGTDAAPRDIIAQNRRLPTFADIVMRIYCLWLRFVAQALILNNAILPRVNLSRPAARSVHLGG